MLATSGEVLRFERVLAAPRRLVFAALTEAGLMRRWMCPETYQVTEAEADLRPGGRFRVVMRDPGGARYPVSGEYTEVRPPELVEFTWTWEPGHTMAGIETRVRVELRERDHGTLMVMTHSGLPDAAERESHRGGWTGALAQLERLIEEEVERWTT